MFKEEARRRLPVIPFRKWLIGLHRDLLTIHDKISTFAVYYPEELTIFEKLVIVLEDRRFFDHSGVDLIAALREAYKYLFATKNGGASTIDMQFVRTATGYYERTFRRKLYEALLAGIIQFRYSKITILRSYLAIAYFGWTLRGANEASQKMFNKRSEDLNQGEAALLASFLVFPVPKHANGEWATRALRRANYIEAIYVRRKKRFDQIARREVVKSA